MLCTDKSRFYRVKRGQSGRLVEETLGIPAACAFAGEIIPLDEYIRYSVQPFETYASIAEKFSISEEKLKRLNGGKILYPTCKIFVPLYNPQTQN